MLYNLNTVLAHSAKGTTWKIHKYIKKMGDRYIYPAMHTVASIKRKYASNYSNQNIIADKSKESSYASVTNKSTGSLNVKNDVEDCLLLLEHNGRGTFKLFAAVGRRVVSKMK